MKIGEKWAANLWSAPASRNSATLTPVPVHSEPLLLTGSQLSQLSSLTDFLPPPRGPIHAAHTQVP